MVRRCFLHVSIALQATCSPLVVLAHTCCAGLTTQEAVDICNLDLLCSGFQYEPALPGTPWRASRATLKASGAMGLNMSRVVVMPRSAVYIPDPVQGMQQMMASPPPTIVVDRARPDEFPDGALGEPFGPCMDVHHSRVQVLWPPIYRSGQHSLQ